MKQINKIYLIIVIFITLTTSSVLATPMESMFETWYNESIENVIKSWGKPTVINYQEGQTKYIWRKQISKKIPNTDIQKTFKCDRILYVDISGKVVFGKTDGNACSHKVDEIKELENKKS